MRKSDEWEEKKVETIQSRDHMRTSPHHTSELCLELPSTQNNILKTETNQMLVGEARAQGNFSAVWSVEVKVKGS